MILSKQLELQVTILNTNNLPLYGIKYSHLIQIFLNSSVWPVDGTLTGTTNLGQSGPGSNVNEEVLHTPQIFRTRASPWDAVKCQTKDTPLGGIPLRRGYSQQPHQFSVLQHRNVCSIEREKIRFKNKNIFTGSLKKIDQIGLKWSQILRVCVKTTQNSVLFYSFIHLFIQVSKGHSQKKKKAIKN